MPEPVKTRGYDSRLRKEQAEATRLTVLRAARDLFLSQGYAATAVADVARRAKVSVDTVYASVGPKPQLLLAAYDMLLGSSDEPIPAEQRDYVIAIRTATSAQAKIRLYADALAARLPLTAPLFLALAEAGTRDPACRLQHQKISARRRANMASFAADVRSTGQLRNDLTDDQVADLVWSMNSPEYFVLFISAGRTAAQYADLINDVWTHTLLA